MKNQVNWMLPLRTLRALRENALLINIIMLHTLPDLTLRFERLDRATIGF